MTTEKQQFDLSVQRAANGQIVTYKPQQEDPFGAISSFMRTAKSTTESNDNDWDPNAKSETIDSFIEGMDKLQTGLKACGPVTMVYLAKESDRMFDDIKNFLSTGVAPATQT